MRILLLGEEVVEEEVVEVLREERGVWVRMELRALRFCSDGNRVLRIDQAVLLVAGCGEASGDSLRGEGGDSRI